MNSEVKQGAQKPFKEIIKTDIGDAQAFGQAPITFIRQVLTLVAYPALLSNPDFPDDAKKRARTFLEACMGGSIGSYTGSPGLGEVRKCVAKFIEQRDKIPSNFENISMSNGASQAIQDILHLFACDVKCQKAGIMVPIPQFPLYSATTVEFAMTLIGYYLNESEHWALDLSNLKKVIYEAKKYCNPRAIVVINPGNPTGQLLTRKNIEDVIKFAYHENLFILADEVYQDNIYDENSKFHSFKKVVMELGKPYNKVELASFMSASKGWHAECGLRGGYVEIVNMHPKVKLMYDKLTSLTLCANLAGQAALYAITSPPTKDEVSYDLFMKEKNAVLSSLKTKSKIMVHAFNSFEGYKCNNIQGAMYAFPNIKLPPKAIKAAKEANQEPDVFYAFQLLENTGVCVVPGSGFGQKPGTYHFRTTLLPPVNKIKNVLKLFQKFHLNFLEKYK